MIWINFGRWSSSHGSMFTQYRVYKNGWKWTPFVVVDRRYKAGKPNEGITKEEWQK